MKKAKIQRQKITFIFKETDPFKDSVLKEIGHSLEKIKEFFNSPPFPIMVHFAYSRKEFNKFVGQKTPSWMVGYANCSKNEIYFLSPLVFEKESSHKKKDFPRVLTHELVHLFTHQIYPFYEPHWLREGLAYFIAQQGKLDFKQRARLLINNDNFLSRIDTTKNWQRSLYKGAYELSFLWTSFLIKKFGKEKILELLKKIDSSYRRARFNIFFDQIYQQSLASLQGQFIKNYFFFKVQKKKGGEIKNVREN